MDFTAPKESPAITRRITRSMRKDSFETHLPAIRSETQATPHIDTTNSREDRTETLKYSPKSRHPHPIVEPKTFGLIQEGIAHNLYFLVIQAILWNQTYGRQARPVFYALIEKYPNPQHLSKAALVELTAMLQPLGLHNVRARRCIALAKRWVEHPPAPTRKYRRKNYPVATPTRIADSEYEIAHLPGVGPYALDSFRIFHRDEMLGRTKDRVGTGVHQNKFEPEWQRVLPKDKELRAYLRWKWLSEGFLWDEKTGNIVPSCGTYLPVDTATGKLV